MLRALMCKVKQKSDLWCSAQVLSIGTVITPLNTIMIFDCDMVGGWGRKYYDLPSLSDLLNYPSSLLMTINTSFFFQSGICIFHYIWRIIIKMKRSCREGISDSQNYKKPFEKYLHLANTFPQKATQNVTNFSIQGLIRLFVITLL